MVKKNLDLLERNLANKNKLLDELLDWSDRQLALLEDPSMSAEDFDANMEMQDKLLQDLILLNEEADELYEKLHSERLDGDELFASYGESLRVTVTQVNEKTEAYQKKELSIKQNMVAYFENERKNLGTGRRSSKAAMDYYKSMNRSNVVPPQFMDRKK